MKIRGITVDKALLSGNLHVLTIHPPTHNTHQISAIELKERLIQKAGGVPIAEAHFLSEEERSPFDANWSLVFTNDGFTHLVPLI